MASIVKRKNRYSVVYTYKDDDGNQHQKWETFDTNADAKKRKTQIEFEQQSGTFIIPNATTVADLLEEYCSVYGVNNWAMSTYRSKKGLMYNYIIPLIGDVKLDELTPRLMDKFYQSLLKVKTKVVQNKKPKNEYLTVHTVREIHKFLRQTDGRSGNQPCFEKADTGQRLTRCGISQLPSRKYNLQAEMERRRYEIGSRRLRTRPNGYGCRCLQPYNRRGQAI